MPISIASIADLTDEQLVKLLDMAVGKIKIWKKKQRQIEAEQFKRFNDAQSKE